MQTAGAYHPATDNDYIAKALQGWLARWKVKGWKKSDKKPPEHLDLWRETASPMTHQIALVLKAC